MKTQNTQTEKTVTIFQREGRTPHGWEIKSSNKSQCAYGMLICYGAAVREFDGAYFLPNEVVEELIAMGYRVPSEFVYKRTSAINGGIKAN
jgi:hypothetical protein